MKKSIQSKQDIIRDDLETWITELEVLGVMNALSITDISYDAKLPSLIITYKSGIRRGYTGGIANRIYNKFKIQKDETKRNRVE